MPEQVSSDDAGKKSDPEIAAADLLFRDDPKEKPAKPEITSAPVGEWGEVFDLAPEPEPTPGSSSAPVQERPRPVSGSPRPRPADRPREVKAPRSEAPAMRIPKTSSRKFGLARANGGGHSSFWPAGCS